MSDAGDPHGYDVGKKIKGKKRHVLVDTEGLLLHAIVHAADLQDRDGGVLLMSTLFGLFPFLLKLYADSGNWSAQLHHDNRVAEASNRSESGPVPSYSTIRRYLRVQGLEKRRRVAAWRRAGALAAEAKLAEREVRRYKAK